MSGILFPMQTGTDVAELIGGKAFGRSLMFGADGSDVIGELDPNPDPQSVLGRLLTVANLLAQTNASIDGLEGFVDGLETLTGNLGALIGTQSGYVDGLEGLSGSANALLADLKALLTTQAGYVDGLEALTGSTNTLLTTQAGYVDGLETLIGNSNSLLTAHNGFVDGLEALSGTANGLLTDLKALLTTQAGYLDGIEGLLTALGTAIALTTPADRFAAIVPNDATVLNPVPKSLLVNGAGNVRLKGSDDVIVEFAVTAGTIVPLRAKSVMVATSNAATGIIALY